MEALLSLFAGLILVCALPLISVVGAGLSVALEVLAAVFFLIVKGKTGTRGTAPTANASQNGPPLYKAAHGQGAISRKMLHWAAGISALCGVAGVLAAMFFFEPIVRYAMDVTEDKTGIIISYKKASGSLLKGQLSLTGVRLKRESETGMTFDLEIDQAEADVRLISLLTAEPKIKLAVVQGVRGQISPPKRDKKGPRAAKKKRRFRADYVQISSIEIEVQPKDSEAYLFQIPQATVAPLRSKVALFDLLFRSNMEATIAGQSLKATTKEITENGRETAWNFENVDAKKLKLFVPKAPITWLENGIANIKVKDRWSRSDGWINMNWHVALQDVDVVIPKDVGMGEKLLAGAFAKVVKSRRGNVDFRYVVRLSEDQLVNARSDDLDQFFDNVIKGFLEGDVQEAQTADEVPATKDATKDKVKLRDCVKDLLRKEKKE